MATGSPASPAARWLLAAALAVGYLGAVPLGDWLEENGANHARAWTAPLVGLALCALWRLIYRPAVFRLQVDRRRLVLLSSVGLVAIAAIFSALRWLPPGRGYTGSLIDVVAIALIVPAAEEWLFRGVLLDHFVTERGAVVGVIGTAVLFGLSHRGLAVAGMMAVAGIMLAILSLATRSVLGAFAVHSAWNTITVVGSMDPEQPRRSVALWVAGALALTIVIGIAGVRRRAN